MGLHNLPHPGSSIRRDCLGSLGLTEKTALIAEMVQQIVTNWNPDQIILFGSHARGLAGPDSDVDLLVVVPLNRDRRTIRLGIRRDLSGMGLPKDVVVVSPQEVECYRECPGTIIRAALCEEKFSMSENPERNEMRRPCSCSGAISWRPSGSARMIGASASTITWPSSRRLYTRFGAGLLPPAPPFHGR